MILEIAIKALHKQMASYFGIIRRVFVEASSVRDTMSDSLKRHRIFVTNEQQLREELKIRNCGGHRPSPKTPDA
ncbi:uncharacterized protein AKAME5_001859400 [Lates japonicus]|uniref:Uncharacterized protein n=1 Tax=Lates japonicus TaxID=270547 RepID=A0AAD3N9G5_LATJO|nr:uncharacterized protein AKAME5_001859400 [Lates japonicus]